MFIFTKLRINDPPDERRDPIYYTLKYGRHLEIKEEGFVCFSSFDINLSLLHPLVWLVVVRQHVPLN